MLSFEDAPPYSVPLRFFLSAPVYGVLAGLLLIWQGDAIYLSRWGAPALALTHLLTIGVLMQVMLGALFQFLPVAAGARIERSARWAGIVHAALNVGVLSLCAGFLEFDVRLLALGGLALAAAAGVFLFVAGRALWPAQGVGPTIPALKFALFGLLATVSAGLYLLGVYGFDVRGRPDVLTAQHAAWGLLGWSGLLVIGISYVVVPMFQLTPPYRARFSRLLVPAVAGLLVAWTVVQAAGAEFAIAIAGTALAIVIGAYATTTLRLQARSKRPRADVTVRYWRVAMGLALAAGGLWVIALWQPAGLPRGIEFLIAWLVIPGALVSVIAGMLYKIVPFLSWLHLQNHATEHGGGKVPHMGAFIAEPGMRRQFAAHLVALGLLAGSVFAPGLTRAAGFALLLSFTLLGANLAGAVRTYFRHRAVGARSASPEPR